MNLIKCIPVFVLLLARSPQTRKDILLADFEGRDYGAWTTTGEAFGPGPAHGTLPGQMVVTGYRGHGLVNSFYHGDASTGTLISPPFALTRHYINFLIGGGHHPGETCMNLLVDGKIVRTETGPNDRPGGTERLDWKTWDVRELEGKTARIEIVDRATGGWGHINVDEITLSDQKAETPISTAELYNETYRPQFHFTAKAGWLNDPNGLVFYKGEYHLFFQHNPKGTEWGNMTWGHAVSPDLVHWKQRPNAIEPDTLGTIFSGSAAVDWNNTTGFRTGREAPLLAIYTAAGGTSPESKGKPFTQGIAYSNDRGHTWTKYDGNPVLPHIAAENRDPKIVWRAPTHCWIMALFLDGNDYALFSSPDLKRWDQIQKIHMPGCGECPDFFEIPIDAETGTHRWVLTAANGHYFVGTFDGQKFTPEEGPLAADTGANSYAVQTYSDIPATDGRRIQVAWMSGGSYPQMPFNQQMSFPCVLTLRRTPVGLRLFRWPVKEIRALYSDTKRIDNRELKPGAAVPVGDGELWDVDAEFEIGDSKEVGFEIRGEEAVYSVAEGKLRCLGREAAVAPVNGRIRIRALVDRTSIELFASNGLVSMSSCYLARPTDRALAAFTRGGTARIIRLEAHPLRSAWSHARL